MCGITSHFTHAHKMLLYVHFTQWNFSNSGRRITLNPKHPSTHNPAPRVSAASTLEVEMSCAEQEKTASAPFKSLMVGNISLTSYTTATGTLETRASRKTLTDTR